MNSILLKYLISINISKILIFINKLKIFKTSLDQVRIKKSKIKERNYLIN